MPASWWWKVHGTKYMRDLARSKEYKEKRKRLQESHLKLQIIAPNSYDKACCCSPTTNDTPRRLHFDNAHSTSNCKAPSQNWQTTVVIASSLKHIQNPIDALRRPLKGGILKGGRADDRRTRRSKIGDHGLATRHLVRRWNQGSCTVTKERSWQQPQIS